MTGGLLLRKGGGAPDAPPPLKLSLREMAVWGEPPHLQPAHRSQTGRTPCRAEREGGHRLGEGVSAGEVVER